MRDVVVRHGARVVSDEIHAPLVLPGAEHVSYLSLEGTADHAVAVVAASKAFNTAGLRCAQIVTGDAATARRLRDVPMARNDSWSSLGVVAAVAAYTSGDPWLAALVERLDAQRTLLGELLAAHLPEARMRPLEATYLAWLDLRAYGHERPAEVAKERGKVWVSEGDDYHPGLAGHVRAQHRHLPRPAHRDRPPPGRGSHRPLSGQFCPQIRCRAGSSALRSWPTGQFSRARAPGRSHSGCRTARSADLRWQDCPVSVSPRGGGRPCGPARARGRRGRGCRRRSAWSATR